MNLKPRARLYRGCLVWAVTDDGSVRSYKVDFWEPEQCSIQDTECKKVFRFLPPKWVFTSRKEAVKHAIWLLKNNIEASKRAVAFYNKQLQTQQNNLKLREKELLDGDKMEAR